MSWARIDDGMPENLKVAPLSDGAFRAYVSSICYAARNLTDGFVPNKKAREMAGRPRVVQELVPSLWEVVDGGYMVHDYLDYNPTREKVLAERQAARDRMYAVRSRDVRPNKTRSSHSPYPDPVSPSGFIDQEPPVPRPPSLPNGAGEPGFVVLPVVRAFEQCFGRLLSPMEIENIKALEEEHPRDRIDYALRETAALGKRSVRYVQRVCETQAQNGDQRDAGKPVGRDAAGAAQAGDAVAAALGKYGGAAEFDPDYWAGRGGNSEGGDALDALDGAARVEAQR